MYVNFENKINAVTINFDIFCMIHFSDGYSGDTCSVCPLNFYGATCSVECIAQDDINGHYVCDLLTGAKVGVTFYFYGFTHFIHFPFLLSIFMDLHTLFIFLLFYFIFKTQRRKLIGTAKSIQSIIEIKISCI